MLMLSLISILIVITSLVFSLLSDKTKFFNKIPYFVRQLIIGIVFGGLAILSSHIGYYESNYDILINVRDAASLCAGLFFGLPSGIIAGLIGGLYRYFGVFWGLGDYTQLACSLACLLSGVLSGLARKFMFHDHHPGIGLSIWIGIGCETLHMLLILLTNISTISYAYYIVDECTFIMISFVGLISFFSDLVVERKIYKFKKVTKLRPSFAFSMNISIFFLLLITGSLSYFVNYSVAKVNTSSTMIRYINNVVRIANNDGYDSDTLKETNIGNYGGYLIFDNNDNLVLANRYGNEVNIDTLSFDRSLIKEEYTLYKVHLLDKEVESNSSDIFIMYSISEEINDYKVYVFLSTDEVFESSNLNLYITLYIEILIYITMFCLIYQIVERKMIKPIHRINRDLTSISEGDLSTIVNIKSSEEFIELSDDINLTVNSLKTLISEAEHRNEQDLKLATTIQYSALPSSFEIFKKRRDLDIYALMNTAKEVGGDFYDFYFIDNTHFAILIADVSGKGIGAAMFMMSSKTLIKSLVEKGMSVDEAFIEANKKLCENNEAEMFLTSWMGVIDLETGLLSYVNAGHNPPLIYSKKQDKFIYLKDKPNFILAGLSSAKYTKHELNLSPGDKIYLYTDGVSEAENIDHKLYGETRLIETINKVKDKDIKSILNDVLSDVKNYVGEAPQSDDITMLGFTLNFLSSPYSITIYPDKDSLLTVTDFINYKLEKLNISTSLKNKVEIAVDEIYSNIVKYGDASKVSVSLELIEDKLKIDFIDNGYKFDPLSKEDPDISLKASERKIGGLGIFMVKKLSSSLTYEYRCNLNILCVEFDLKNNKEQY